MSTATSKALASVLDCFNLKGSHRILSYRNSFDSLWSIKTFLSSIKGTAANIVLASDYAIAGSTDVPIGNYLSPADWAVALALTSLKHDAASSAKPASELSPQWRVLVIDTFANRRSSPPRISLLEQLQSSEQPAFPWIFFFSPTEILKLVSACGLQPGEPSTSIDPFVLRRLWAEDLASPQSDSNRHSIANLIGPMVLQRGTETKQLIGTGLPDKLSQALHSLMESIHLIPASVDRVPAPWIERSCWSSEAIKHFILIDDMADKGWADFLRNVLNLRSEELITFTEVSDAYCEIEKLQIRKPGENANLSSLSRTPHILFLDLRLFSRSSWVDEKVFIARLLKQARSFSERGGVWPSFSKDELAGAERCIAAKERIENPDYHIALTLFPRLLALSDPLLPIVIFSSTGRREIVERFLPYENIIVEFDKPRFFGELGSSVVAEAKVKLTKAVTRALRLGHARHVCNSLSQLSKGAPAFARAYDATRLVPRNESIIELYIDESGTKNDHRFAVGGLAIRYPNQRAVNNLNKALASEGLLWGLAEGHVPVRPQDPLPVDGHFLNKRYERAELYEKWLLQIKSVIAKSSPDIKIAAVAVVHNTPLTSQTWLPQVLRNDEMDNLYRTLLEELIESFLFDWLPQWGRDCTEIRIDVATKIGVERDEAARRTLTHDYGLEFPWDKDTPGQTQAAAPEPRDDPREKFISLRSSEAYPIVVRALTRRTMQHCKVPIRRARAVTLIDFEDLRRRKAKEEELLRGKSYRRPFTNTVERALRPMQIHYLADWLCHFAFNPELLTKTSSAWYEEGFLQHRNQRFHRCLAFGRTEDLLEKVMEARSAFMFAPEDSPMPIDKWIKWHLSDVVAGLSAIQVLELCGRLPLSPPRTAGFSHSADTNRNK